jgi:hypothetical protein
MGDRKSQSPIFVIGNSRSGTTLMARILNKHSEIYFMNETHFYDDQWKLRTNFDVYAKKDLLRAINQMLTIQKKDYYRKSEYEEYPEEAEEVYRNYLDKNRRDYSSFILAFMEVEARRQNKTIPGDQTPRHAFAIEGLIELFNDSKFVHMVRDPRAIMLSQKNKWKAAVRKNQPKFEIWRTRTNYHPITMSILWNKVIDEVAKAQGKYGERVIKTVIFEELTGRPQEVVRDVCNFLGIEYSENMLDVDVSMSSNAEKGGRGIDKDIANKWVEGLSPTEVFIVEKICGTRMMKQGYTFSNKKPNYVKLAFLSVYWPIQTGIALLLNLGRMGNPFNYIKRRLLT